jgi:hypothetical protein
VFPASGKELALQLPIHRFVWSRVGGTTTLDLSCLPIHIVRQMSQLWSAKTAEREKLDQITKFDYRQSSRLARTFSFWGALTATTSSKQRAKCFSVLLLLLSCTTPEVPWEFKLKP